MKELCDWFGLDRSGEKDVLINRVFEYLASPVPIKGQPTPAKRKRPSKKASADRVKRPKSAFMIYTMETRKAIQEANPGMSVTVIAKIIGERWRNLSPEEKQNYQEMSELERATLLGAAKPARPDEGLDDDFAEDDDSEEEEADEPDTDTAIHDTTHDQELDVELSTSDEVCHVRIFEFKTLTPIGSY